MRKPDRDWGEVTNELIRPGDVGVLPGRAADWRPDDFEAWQDFVSRWRVAGPYPITVRCYQNGPVVCIGFTMKTIEAKPPATDEPMLIMLDVYVPTPIPIPESKRWLRALLRWFTLHELDEWIDVDGKRIFDQHVPGQPPPTPADS